MKIKTRLLIGAISATSIMASSATVAANFSSTFTGDNTVLSFSYAVNGNVTNFDLSSLSTNDLNSWGYSSSISLSGLADNANYEFIWEVSNTIARSGFLADITLDSTLYTSSAGNGIWSVSNDETNWFSPTSYYSNSPASPAWWRSIAGIDSGAEWLWDDSNQTSGERLFFKASITSPIPEPSTYALMLGGLGLVGFMAARRRKTS